MFTIFLPSMSDFIETQADATTVLNLAQLYPDNWQATKEYINKLTEEIEGLLIEKDSQKERLLLNLTLLVKRTNCINEVLEKNWYAFEREETPRELEKLKKLSQEIEELFNSLKALNINLDLGELTLQLEVLADLLLCIVDGQRITELVWEIRNQSSTPKENLEIDRIIEEVLQGEPQ